jgi:hypothetical protein
MFWFEFLKSADFCLRKFGVIFHCGCLPFVFNISVYQFRNVIFRVLFDPVRSFILVIFVFVFVFIRTRNISRFFVAPITGPLHRCLPGVVVFQRFGDFEGVPICCKMVRKRINKKFLVVNYVSNFNSRCNSG